MANRVVVDVSNVWKSYGSNSVLKGVSVRLFAGQIQALLGGNGAGKSTLMKIISGLTTADQGSIEINGHKLITATPAVAQKQGLYLVPQEAQIFPNQTVLDNICLGLKSKPQSFLGIVEGLLTDLGVSLDLCAQAATLEIADRQLVEIMRGLIRKASVLILDEPTSALTPHEAGKLFSYLRRLQSQGVGVFFISHRLPEIREICSTISVLRDGAVVLSGELRDYEDARIIKAMSKDSRLGKATYPHRDIPVLKKQTEILKVKHFSGEGFHDVSFKVHSGEVVGLAGVVGSGRSRLAESLFGLRRTSTGHIKFLGQDIPHLSPRKCVEKRIIYLPKDRQQNGLFINAGIMWNMLGYIMHCLALFPKRSKETSLFEKFRKDLGIVCTDQRQAVTNLSGGNQQKVLLAKCLAANPKLLILDEPTRGVDVTARNDIYQLINRLSEKGLGIILISSDFDEIKRLADCVIVMEHGQQCGVLKGKSISIDAIARLAFGSRDVAYA